MSEDTIPKSHVLAVIPSSSAAREAAADLERRGFGRPEVLAGRRAEAKIQTTSDKRNPIAAALKFAIEHLSEEESYLEQYEEQAQAGANVLTLKVKDREEAERVRDVLQFHGAVNIRYFGKLAVADLTPQTNPSAPSDARPLPRDTEAS